MGNLAKNDAVTYQEAVTLITKTLKAKSIKDFETYAEDCLEYLTELFIRNDKNDSFAESRKKTYKDYSPLKSSELAFLETQKNALLDKCEMLLAAANETILSSPDLKAKAAIEAKVRTHILEHIKRLITNTFSTLAEKPEPTPPSPTGVADELGPEYLNTSEAVPCKLFSETLETPKAPEKPYLSLVELVKFLNADETQLTTAIQTYISNFLWILGSFNKLGLNQKFESAFAKLYWNSINEDTLSIFLQAIEYQETLKKSGYHFKDCLKDLRLSPTFQKMVSESRYKEPSLSMFHTLCNAADDEDAKFEHRLGYPKIYKRIKSKPTPLPTIHETRTVFLNNIRHPLLCAALQTSAASISI